MTCMVMILFLRSSTRDFSIDFKGRKVFHWLMRVSRPFHVPSSVLRSGNVIINRLNSSPEEICILCPRGQSWGLLHVCTASWTQGLTISMPTAPLTHSFRASNSLMMAGQRRRLGSSLQSKCCYQASWAPEPQASSPDLGTATVMTV